MRESALKKRPSQFGTNAYVRGATQLRFPLTKKPVDDATGKRPASLITQVQQDLLLIPFTLITAVCPFEANGCLSPQRLRGPFNTSVCAASHPSLLSVTPCSCLLFLINVCFYVVVVLIIGKSKFLSRHRQKVLKNLIGQYP